MNTPLITVAMPAYNAEKYIGEAIDSILTQTLEDFELLILNDGSTDATEKIIQSYSDPRIRYYANDKNIGFSETRNRLIKLAKGKYIANADSDDISHPDRLAIQSAFLEQNPGIAAAGARVLAFSGTPPPFTAIKPGAQVRLRQTAEQTRSRIYFSGNIIPDPVTMFRSETFEKHNIYYDSRLGVATDLDLYIRLACVTDLVKLRQRLLLYRWHTTNMSGDKGQGKKFTRNIRVKLYKETMGVDLSEILNEFYEVDNITGYHKMAAAAGRVIAERSNDPRFDRATLIIKATALLYSLLQKLEKRGYGYAALYGAYRQTRLLDNLPLKSRRRFYRKVVWEYITNMRVPRLFLNFLRKI